VKELQGKILRQPVPEDQIVSALDLEGKDEPPVTTTPEPDKTPVAEPPHKITIIGGGFNRQEVEVKDSSKPRKKKAEKQ